MKLLTILAIPCLLLSFLLPAPAADAWEGQHSGIHRQLLNDAADRYASSELKAELKKDLATHDRLIEQYKKSSATEDRKNKNAAFDMQRKAEADRILKQVEAGKMTADEAGRRLAMLCRPQHRTISGHFRLMRQLRKAVASHDKTTVQAALKELDQQIKQSNRHLQQKLSTG